MLESPRCASAKQLTSFGLSATTAVQRVRLVVSNVGVGRDAPRLAGEELGRRASSRLLLELEVGEHLTGGVRHGEAGVGFLGGQDGGKRRAKDMISGIRC
jgi:hypothetical protein